MSLIPLRAVAPLDIVPNLLDHCLSVVPLPRNLPFFHTDPWKTHTYSCVLACYLGWEGDVSLAMSCKVPCFSTSLRPTCFDHGLINKLVVLPSGPSKMQLQFSCRNLVALA
jgi:hypothetical protein